MKLDWKQDLVQARLGNLAIGGGRSLPLSAMDGPLSHRPLVGLEMEDTIQPFNDALQAQYGSTPATTLEWLDTIHRFSPDFISLYLSSVNRDTGSRTVGEALFELEKLVPHVRLPIVLWGSEDEEVDRELLPAAAKLFAGKRIAFGPATETCYREISRAALDYDHLVIALSPLDINLAKQLNLLLRDAGVPPERSIIFPTTGALGYGLEYAFSTMERTRVEGLKGDNFLSQPMLALVGREAWKAKEAGMSSPPADGRSSGASDKAPREAKEFDYEMGVSWETVTGVAMIAAGADLLVMRGPLAAVALKDFTITKLGRWS